MKIVSKQSIVNERWELYYSGVMIIASKKLSPVFIFKEFMQPLLGFPFHNKLGRGFEDGSDNDYCVFWNKKNYGHNLPPDILNKDQKELIEMLINQAIPTFIYIDDMLSKNIIELPIGYVFDNRIIKIKSEYVSSFREMLKDMKFIPEARKRHMGQMAKIRREFVFKKCSKYLNNSKQKYKRIKIAEKIWDEWTKEVNTNEWDDKYHFTPMTIRRDIEDFKKSRLKK